MITIDKSKVTQCVKEYLSGDKMSARITLQEAAKSAIDEAISNKVEAKRKSFVDQTPATK
jgi:hypothetical protein